MTGSLTSVHVAGGLVGGLGLAVGKELASDPLHVG